MPRQDLRGQEQSRILVLLHPKEHISLNFITTRPNKQHKPTHRPYALLVSESNPFAFPFHHQQRKCFQATNRYLIKLTGLICLYSINLIHSIQRAMLKLHAESDISALQQTDPLYCVSEGCRDVNGHSQACVMWVCVAAC